MQLFEYIDILNQPYDIFVTESTHCNAHWHYYCEILYILEGTVGVRGDGQAYTLHPGELCFIYPRQIHEICPTGDIAKYAVLKFDIHSLHLPQAYSGKLHSFFTKKPQDAAICIHLHGEPQDTSLKPLILQTIEEYQMKKDFYMLQIQANLSSLLIAIARHAPETQNSAGSSPESQAPFFHQILEYIDAHSGSPLQAQELARMCNMSYSHFAKLFRETYGRSCKEYIAYVRINKAQEYLLHTDYDLNYIAMECGFFDCSHFIRTYKKWRGITPRQERIRKINT